MKKRFLVFLLAALLIASMTACTGNDNPETDTTAAEETTLPEETTAPDVAPTPGAASDATVVKLNYGTVDIFTYGIRELEDASMLNCDQVGSGFEIKIDSEGGTVAVRTRTADATAFRVFVDGVGVKTADGSDYFVINGVKNIEFEVTAGEHTVRVIRVSDAIVGAASFYNITFEGKQMVHADSTEEPLRVEFVGDGITAGEGLAESGDVTQAYSYLTAHKLNADYAITAFTGKGLATGATPIATAYSKSGNYDTPADVIVVNVGLEDVALTGDDAVTAEDLAKAYEELLKTIRQKNGPTAKVVCVTTSANEVLTAAVTAAVESVGGNAAGYYAKALTASAAKLPTAAEHAAYADELVAYITSIKDNEVVSPELVGSASGYGVEIDYASGEWKS